MRKIKFSNIEEVPSEVINLLSLDSESKYENPLTKDEIKEIDDLIVYIRENFDKDLNYTYIDGEGNFCYIRGIILKDSSIKIKSHFSDFKDSILLFEGDIQVEDNNQNCKIGKQATIDSENIKIVVDGNIDKIHYEKDFIIKDKKLYITAIDYNWINRNKKINGTTSIFNSIAILKELNQTSVSIIKNLNVEIGKGGETTDLESKKKKSVDLYNKRSKYIDILSTFTMPRTTQLMSILGKVCDLDTESPTSEVCSTGDVRNWSPNSIH